MAKLPPKSSSPNNMFGQGALLHKSGKWEEAETIYRQLLRQNPHHAEALHLLGILMHQQGKNELAAEYIRKSVDENPLNPIYYLSLGNVLRLINRAEDAIAAYREAIRLKPDYLNAYNNLGILFKDLKRYDEAKDCFSEAIRIEPVNADSYVLLASLLRDMNQRDESMKYYQKALEIKPDHAEALNNLGNLFKELSQPDEAMKCYRRAIESDPSYPFSYNGLAVIHLERKEPEEAEKFYRKAVLLKSDYAEAHSNLGKFLMNEGNIKESIVHLQSALQLRPHLADSYHSLGTAFVKDRRIEEALDLFEKGLKLDPENANIHWNRAYAWLLQGDYLRGWPEFNWRFRLSTFPRRKFDKPPWQGELLKGKRILVLIEQGFGDTFQFVRYLPLIQERGGYVIFECKTETRSLFTGLKGVNELADQGKSGAQANREYDTYVYLLSLPSIFKTTVDTIPTVKGCVEIDSESLEFWREKMHRENCFKIGIVWGCESANETYRIRSTSLSNFEFLADFPNVAIYSLQKGEAASQLAVKSEFTSRIIDLGKEINNFKDTAAIIKNLDLVITVDTSVAHLAGLLQKPGWVLLPSESDWRWLLEREDTPWYPTIRLFRQSEEQRWEPVFQRIARELSRFQNDTFPSTPPSVL